MATASRVSVATTTEKGKAGDRGPQETYHGLEKTGRRRRPSVHVVSDTRPLIPTGRLPVVHSTGGQEIGTTAQAGGRVPAGDPRCRARHRCRAWLRRDHGRAAH